MEELSFGTEISQSAVGFSFFIIWWLLKTPPKGLVTNGSPGIAPSPQQSDLLKRISHLWGHFLLCLQQQPAVRSSARGLHFSLRFSDSWGKVWAAKASGSVPVRMVSWHVKFKHSHKLKLLLERLEFLLTAAITKKSVCKRFNVWLSYFYFFFFWLEG